jgi:hypothetical protein
MKRDFILFSLICVVFTACVRPPDYPIEPRLSLPTTGNALSKNTMVQGYKGDSLYLTLNFTDGDGDIGLSKGDTSLFIVDTRDNSLINDAAGLPSVPAQGAGNGISGEMRIKLLSTCCKTLRPCQPTPAQPKDVVIYEVYIKDRAGNISNRLKIPPITLLCQ